MRRVILFFSLWMVSWVIYAQDRSIRFEEGTFQEALDKAKKADKLLFVDCYTSWCGPCKMLAREVFTQNEVADYFNANFISLKMDCEKGEGPAMGKRFGVSAYPTLLFIDGDGELVYKTTGASAPDHFLKKIKEGLKPENLLSVKERKYAAGERDKAFMLDLIASYKGVKNDKKATQVSNELLKSLTEEEIVAKEMWNVVSYYYISNCGTEWWNFILKHSDEYSQLVGRDVVVKMIGDTMHPFLFGYACGGKKSTDRELFNEYKAIIDRYSPKQAETLYAFLKLGESASFDKFDKYFKTITTVVPKMPQAEHYRFWVNAWKNIQPFVTDKQKKQLVKLVEEDMEKSNEYLQKSYKGLLENITQE